jgi:hypothetical protein
MHGGAPAAAPGHRVDRSLDRRRDREVAVVASGVINLVEQTLRLELRPSVKKGSA